MRTELKPLRLFMTADAVGGVFSYALDLAEGLAPLGFQTTLALLGPAMSPAQSRLAAGRPYLDLIETRLPLDWMAQDPAEVEMAAREVAVLATAVAADIVQLNTPALGIAAFSAPVVAVVHSCLASWWRAVHGGELPDDFTWRTHLLARGLEGADLIAAPSAAFAREVAGLYRCAVTPVRNGRAAGAPPSSGPLPACAFTAGRLWDAGKNARTLDAAAGLSRLPLKAAGPLSGPEGSRFRPTHLEALGRISEAEVRAHLSSRPIFVSAALYEPFGLSVLEAAQAGCALVLSDIPTFRELWEGAALLVPPRDPAALAAALDALAAEPARRSALGTAAATRAARYSLPAMAAGMAALYRPLAARRSPEAAA